MPYQPEFNFAPDAATEQKIRKLLRLAANKGATPAEAAAAMAKARELAARAGIDTGSISTDVAEDKMAQSPLAHVAVPAPKTIVENLAAGIACDQFLCHRIMAERRGHKTIHYFIGPSAFVSLAGYVFEYLRKTMARAWRTRPNRRLRDRRAFLIGFAVSIHDSIPEEFRNRAMITDAEAEAYAIEKIFGSGTSITTAKPSKRKPISGKAVLAGRAAGRAAGIRNALTA